MLSSRVQEPLDECQDYKPGSEDESLLVDSRDWMPLGEAESLLGRRSANRRWGEVLVPPPLSFRSLLLHCALLPYSYCYFFVISGAGYTCIFGLHPLLFPLTVSRAGRMSSASSHSESRSVELSTHRFRVLSHPSGDPVSVAVVPSTSALGDSGTADALAAMQSFFNVDSTVTARRLVEVRKNYFIPPEYKLHVPLLGDRPYNAFSCGFGLSTDAHEAGLQFSLHPVIEACLEQWRISPSQMASNLWRYLVAFMWECHVSGIRATQELFMVYFRLSRGQAGYYLATCSGFHMSDAPFSDKGWKSHFFFISCRQGWSFPTE
ncbi:hypothetical protein BHE74_00044013 [Ensete ventricosum]|nr:hypothetical protein BHE74_00044013 [Ensete ventricosum]RZS18522.1 hypothetical protein BHM03_00050809 [Ensete ventricosum]